MVISIDPRRVYIPGTTDISSFPHEYIPTEFLGPNGECHVWYQARSGVPPVVQSLARAVERPGAGEILLNRARTVLTLALTSSLSKL